MLTLGSLTLGAGPCVAIALRDGVSVSEVRRAMDAGAHVLEFRVDEFSRHDSAFVAGEIKRFAGIPAIGTIRAAAEGGAWHGAEAERAALYQAILPHVDAIDIELSSSAIIDGIVSAAHAASRLVLGSYHNFSATPELEVLAALAETAKQRGVDILKVAAHCATSDDLRTLARFTIDYADRHIVTIGMGPQGVISRMLFPALGSLLTYTFLGAPTAPGQLNCETTLQYLELFYPKGEIKQRGATAPVRDD